MKRSKEGQPQNEGIRNIQLKVPSNLYKRFKLVCTERETNMRSMLLMVIKMYVEHEEKMIRIAQTDVREWISDDELAMSIFSGATRKAIADTNELGLPTPHADIHGIYYLYPDGHKEYVSDTEAAEALKGQTRYNTDPDSLRALGEARDDILKGHSSGR